MLSPKSGNKSIHLLFLLLVSALSGIIAYFLLDLSADTKNNIITIAFSFFIFSLNFILFLLISDRDIRGTFAVKTNLVFKGFFYIALGVISSICILVIPQAVVQLNETSILLSISSLAPISYIRLISAFFLTSFFPGVAVYFAFLRKYDFNVVEKIGIVILISYCFTVISGLLLGLFQAFSTATYVLTFWLFAAVMFGYRQIKLNNKTELPVKSPSFSFDLNIVAIVVAACALVLLAYIQVLMSAPMSGIVGGDTLDYMVSANRFIWSDVFGWSQYVWSNNFYLFISNLAGLPMHFVYAGLQFYLIIPIGAFYFLVRTIFPDYKKIAAIATMLCFFVAGVTSWLLFYNPMTSSKLFQFTGAPGITPFALSPWIFDLGFLFFALAFVYRGAFKKECKLINYFLPAIFVVAAYFSHSFNIIFVFLFSLVILGLFLSKGRMYVLKLSLLTLVLALALDPLSKWMLAATIFAVAIRLNVTLASVLSFFLVVIVAIAIGITAHFTLSFVRKRNLHLQFSQSSNIIGRTKTALSDKKTKFLFYFGGFTIFVVAVTLYLWHYTDSSYISINTDPNFVFPWYMIVFRSFGIILPFALASIPFMVPRGRSSLLFMSVLSTAIFVSTAVTLSLPPEIIPHYIGYVRYIGYLVIPLSILAAFGIFYSVQNLKKRYLKALFVIILVVLVSTSILSQAYVREMFYDSPENSVISTYEPSAINWINNNTNVPKGATILTLSNDSEKILSNLVLDVKVPPNFQTWYLKGVLSNSTAEVVINCLNTLGVDYVFVRSKDSLGDSNFYSVIQSFPKVQTFDQAVIYRVPSEDWSLPYFSSLFQKITFSLYEQHTGSTPMNNKVVWFDGMNAYGDVRVTSSNININLTGEKLAVASMSVITSNGNINFKNKTLSDVSINGAGEIMTGKAQPVQFSNASNLNANVDLADSRNITLSFSGANINYKDGSSQSDYRNVDIIITLDSANSLVSLCKQPNVTISGEYGSVSGYALGLAKGITFDKTKPVMLWGNFTVNIPYADNLLYSQITSAKELNVSWNK